MTLEHTTKGTSERHKKLLATVEAESPALAATLAREDFSTNQLPRAERLRLQLQGQQARLTKLTSQINSSQGEDKNNLEAEKARVIKDMTGRIPLKLMNLGYFLADAAQGLVQLASSIISDISKSWMTFTAQFRSQASEFQQSVVQTAEYLGGSSISPMGYRISQAALRNRSIQGESQGMCLQEVGHTLTIAGVKNPRTARRAIGSIEYFRKNPNFIEESGLTATDATMQSLPVGTVVVYQKPIDAGRSIENSREAGHAQVKVIKNGTACWVSDHWQGDGTVYPMSPNQKIWVFKPVDYYRKIVA